MNHCGQLGHLQFEFVDPLGHYYVFIDWVGGLDGKIFGSWSGRTDRASWPRAKYFLVRPGVFSFSFFGRTRPLWPVRISSRAVCVFPALSLWPIRPSYGTFFLMVFQGNCSWGRTGHMIIFVTNCLLTESEVLKGNSQTDREREQAQYGKAEVWDFPAKTQRLRLISCLLI